ncbi:hypothetical protein EMCRGX_G018423 [Ephydatia muelleri]
MPLPTSCVVVAAAALVLASLGETAPVSSSNGFLLETTIDCDLCETVLSIVQALLRENRSEDFIAAIVTRICISLKFKNVDSTVCSGIVQSFKDEVLTVLNVDVADPKLICRHLVSSCPAPPNPTKPWYVPLPDTPKPPVLPVPAPPPGSPVNRILHLSDIHYDPLYTPGLTNQCGEPLCCRTPNAKGTIPTNTAGFWGDYACDPPLWLVESAFQYLASVQDTFDWIYVTGDLPPHDVWSETRESVLDVIGVTYDLIRKYLPDKPVYSAIGNHDTNPVNSFPPQFITGNLSEQWLYEGLAEQWKDWLPEDALTTLKWGGFYVAKVQEGLKVISLQTNYGNSENYWLYMNETDPAGHLAWLAEQLQIAEDNGEKVHLIGHIPPSQTLHSWGYNFYNILNRYESTIVGQFYGHTHSDEFIVMYDQKNATRPTSVAFVEPSITTFIGVNPGFCLSVIDGIRSNSTHSMLDKECYYMNLTDANLHNKTNWQFEYSAKKSYGMSAFQPVDFDGLIGRMAKDSSLLDSYVLYRSKMVPTGPVNVTATIESLIWPPPLP